ncbi:hypothetical protein JQ593_36435 [Bradyrhizobium viridifuturi]|jgi:hypothetical protein|uniref:hypothetical protein n=1 Tax=Bradyrhizobium sp. TaxID=376 RepID=UPI0003FADB8A|nr:hypothetical protein [uncultured Bradyrhizobium sp.]MBR1041568.1 hypothetical protein [Bradyrhizobium viridifuturi]OYU62105.1 MAG: hypothetical protein CFE30_12205 [Bradyrhizobium sp. PARBB1]PSO28252.1 hypothetical protein C7G43_03545 [Bradyrhizobium sp. MOS004]HAQ80637.1 hypothetical protein [Bradyrhizobium sp.]MBR1078592.1 hypothetical protein [Bradyrhizobium viridifuturi]
MARPFIVVATTLAGGAAVGPVQLHGAGSYSRTGGGVKREVISHASGSWSVLGCRQAILEVAP